MGTGRNYGGSTSVPCSRSMPAIEHLGLAWFYDLMRTLCGSTPWWIDGHVRHQCLGKVFGSTRKPVRPVDYDPKVPVRCVMPAVRVNAGGGVEGRV